MTFVMLFRGFISIFLLLIINPLSMFNIFKTSRSVILSIDEFFDKIDLGNLNFKQGIQNYINGNTDDFLKNINEIMILESEADSIQRKIENDFYLHSLMPNYASDVLNLIESVDDVVDMGKAVLRQFEVETPYIPETIRNDYLELANLSSKSVEHVIPAARTFFVQPENVKDGLQKVLFYHRETDNLSTNIKRKIFQQSDELKLSEKIHLRYFALHIEQVSDVAKNIAQQLSSLVIKIKI